MTLSIADLVPLEGAVIEAAIDGYVTSSLTGATPPEVVAINSEYLVVDGNHRVYAAKRLGWAQIDVMIVQNKSNKAFRANALRHALRRGRKGFSNITVVTSDAERKTFTALHRREDEADDFGR